MAVASTTLALLSALAVGWLVVLLVRAAHLQNQPSLHESRPGRRRLVRRLAAGHVFETVGAIVGGLLAYLLLGLLVPSVVIASLGWGIAAAYRRWRGARRATLMAAALLTATDLLAQLLPAGHSTRQALVVLAHSGPVEFRGEVSRILARLDEIPLEDALTEAQIRIRQPLFTLIASALVVGNRSGGRLAPLLQELSRAAHQLDAVQGQLRAEQAQGRLGALVIALMPLALLVLLHVVNPQYLEPYSTFGGQLLLGGLIAMIVVGYIWMLRILRLPQPDLLSLAPQQKPRRESNLSPPAALPATADVPMRQMVPIIRRSPSSENPGN
jgi:tight adherence protein B